MARNTKTTQPAAPAASEIQAKIQGPASTNINWQGPLNNHLARLIRDGYENYLAPKYGQTKLGICKDWAAVMGIGNLDPKGKKTKQNVTKLISNWKRAHQLALSTGFGSTIRNGQLISAEQQLNDICDVYNELYETLAGRRTSTVTGGLNENGIIVPQRQPSQPSQLATQVLESTNAGTGPDSLHWLQLDSEFEAVELEEEYEDAISDHASASTGIPSARAFRHTPNETDSLSNNDANSTTGTQRISRPFKRTYNETEHSDNDESSTTVTRRISRPFRRV